MDIVSTVLEFNVRAAINPPSKFTSEKTYAAECVFALQPSFESLLKAAESAGWDKVCVLRALIALALDEDDDSATRM